MVNTEDGIMNCGCGGGSWFWLIILFLFMFWGGGNGWNNNAAQGALTRAEMYEGFNNNQLENGQRYIERSLFDLNGSTKDAFASVQYRMMDGFNGVDRSLCCGFNGVQSAIAENRFAAQQCCCETNRNIDSVRAENYKNTCEITTAIHAEGEATRALINANTMQELRDRLADRDRDLMTANFQLSQQAQSAALVNELRPCPVPAYPSCSPYQTFSWGQCCGGCCGN